MAIRSGAAAHRLRVRDSLVSLGANPDLIARRRLPLFSDAKRFGCVGVGTDGRDKFLTPAAAAAWTAMNHAAQADGIPLLLISAFRSFDYQLALIRSKLAAGRHIDEILTVNAPPGCSEHHSGRAVDIGFPELAALQEDFELSPAFAWLGSHAATFDFELSYPRGNAQGYLYEPWHWCFARR